MASSVESSRAPVFSTLASSVSSGTHKIILTASHSAARADSHARRLGEKIAVTSKQFLSTAMERLGDSQSRFWHSNLPPLPEGLRDCPEGSVDIVLPSSDAERLECLRDLGRTMQGGSILVLGRRRLYPVRPDHQENVGNVNAESCSAALDVLADAIAQELLDQGFGLTSSGVNTLMCRRGTLGVNSHLEEDDTPSPEHLQRLKERKIDQAVLRALAEECAVNISVSPGMQLVVERGLPPVLLQPTFVICIGGGQVRVLTFAFIGEPVTGDRPDRKRTPFSIRLATDNLLPSATSAFSIRSAKLKYAAHGVDPAVQTTLDMIVLLEEELFAANEAGDWQKLAALEPVLLEEDLVDAEPKEIERRRMESESWLSQTEIAEGYGSATVAAAPANSAQLPGLPQKASRRLSWLLHRFAPRQHLASEESETPAHGETSIGLAGSVYGNEGL
ncbi:Uncharacterized protein SCF082_LOCUS4834 [Durusdinium trenchii]|uniref:Uncharacterized protein n=1 Tax=Durusdinium trenchii TaxID=1381693 RepID=A0ABP0I1T5_9DINO